MQPWEACDRRRQLDCQLPSHSCSSSLDVAEISLLFFVFFLFTSFFHQFYLVFLSSYIFQVWIAAGNVTKSKSGDHGRICRRSTNALPLGAWSTMPVLAGAAVCSERHLSNLWRQRNSYEISKMRQFCNFNNKSHVFVCFGALTLVHMGKGEE